jgi:hypothetical protein
MNEFVFIGRPTEVMSGQNKGDQACEEGVAHIKVIKLLAEEYGRKKVVKVLEVYITYFINF